METVSPVTHQLPPTRLPEPVTKVSTNVSQQAMDAIVAGDHAELARLLALPGSHCNGHERTYHLASARIAQVRGKLKDWNSPTRVVQTYEKIDPTKRDGALTLAFKLRDEKAFEMLVAHPSTHVGCIILKTWSRDSHLQYLIEYAGRIDGSGDPADVRMLTHLLQARPEEHILLDSTYPLGTLAWAAALGRDFFSLLVEDPRINLRTMHNIISLSSLSIHDRLWTVEVLLRSPRFDPALVYARIPREEWKAHALDEASVRLMADPRMGLAPAARAAFALVHAINSRDMDLFRQALADPDLGPNYRDHVWAGHHPTPEMLQLMEERCIGPAPGPAGNGVK